MSDLGLVYVYNTTSGIISDSLRADISALARQLMKSSPKSLGNSIFGVMSENDRVEKRRTGRLVLYKYQDWSLGNNPDATLVTLEVKLRNEFDQKDVELQAVFESLYNRDLSCTYGFDLWSTDEEYDCLDRWYLNTETINLPSLRSFITQKNECL